MDTTNFNRTPNIRESNNSDMILQSVTERRSITDLFLDDFENTEINHSRASKEHFKYQLPLNKAVHIKNVQPFSLNNKIQNEPSVKLESIDTTIPFIVANTVEVPLIHLKQDCTIPVFSKDNEKTIAHQEFVEVILNAVRKVFPQHRIAEPEIRVSHQIKGRIPSAIYKSTQDLLEEDKTIYYERMAFMIKIPLCCDPSSNNFS